MAFGSLVDHAETLGLRSIAASQGTGPCALVTKRLFAETELGSVVFAHPLIFR